MMEASSSSSSSKRLRDDGADAALLRAVLSHLPHRAAKGQILQNWHKAAESVAADAGGSLTGDACRRRYAKLLVMARRESVADWPAEMKELLAAALVENTQWKIETGVIDPDSVARNTRGAVNGIKQEEIKAAVAVKKAKTVNNCKGHEVVDVKLGRVVARLDTMEKLWVQRRDEDQDRAEKQAEAMKRSVVEAQEKVAVLGASLLASEQANGRLQDQVTALRTQLEEVSRDKDHVRHDLSVLRAELLRECGDRKQEAIEISRSTEGMIGALSTDLKALLMAHSQHHEARMKAKCEEIHESVRRELQRRDDLLLSLQKLLETYERQRDIQEAHRKSVLALEKSEREEHQAEVHERLATVEHDLRTLSEELMSYRQPKREDPAELLDGKFHELQAALHAEIHERRSEHTNLLLSIRRILTTSANSDTESE